MENNRNFFLALALSFAVLMGWQFFVAAPRMEAEKARQERLAVQEAATQEQTQEQAGTVPSVTAG